MRGWWWVEEEEEEKKKKVVVVSMVVAVATDQRERLPHEKFRVCEGCPETLKF